MIVPVKEPTSRQTMSYAAFHNTFPLPLNIGSSIAAVGADRSGSLGAHFRLVDPKSANKTTVMLTSSHAIRKKGHHEETNIAIQSPSRKDIETLLPGEQSRLDLVNEQAERAREKGDLKIRDMKLTRVKEITNKMQCIPLL
jgi:hypothetical protein